jgi:hypothetical protein
MRTLGAGGRGGRLPLGAPISVAQLEDDLAGRGEGRDGGGVPRQRAGGTEVGQLGVARCREQDVLRLEVSEGEAEAGGWGCTVGEREGHA